MSKKKHIMYPRRVVSFSKPYHFVEKQKDYIGFICPYCLNAMVFRASVTMNIQSIEKDSQYSVSMIPHYFIQCTQCGETYEHTSVLDPNITPIIALLHMKGYFTKASCEGHRVNQEDVELPYISFTYPDQAFVVNDVPLQGPWYLDTTTNDFIIRCKDVKVPIRERMAHLRRWARALPDITMNDNNEWVYGYTDYKNKPEYLELGTPLNDEDTTDNPNKEYNPEEEDGIIIHDPEQNHGKKTYSNPEEIRHRNDPDYDYEAVKEQRRLAAEANRNNKKRSYNDRYGYKSKQTIKTIPSKDRPKVSTGGVRSYTQQVRAQKPKSTKVSTYTNKQKKNKPVWNPETKQQEYK